MRDDSLPHFANLRDGELMRVPLSRRADLTIYGVCGVALILLLALSLVYGEAEPAQRFADRVQNEPF